MQDRLIELIHESDLSLDSVRLADHLLANGVVVLPCKVGDKVYYISFGKIIEECNVDAVEYTEKAIVIKCHLWRKECEVLLHKHLIYFDNNDFEKTAFLSREEAEKALTKTKGGAE